jgi:hypothetical protein
MIISQGRCKIDGDSDEVPERLIELHYCPKKLFSNFVLLYADVKVKPG